MNINELKLKPIWQMTGEEFLYLHQNSEQKTVANPSITSPNKKYVYGILGIAQLFGCSMPTAHRIKKSGKINRAITQVGRKIIVDADLALELAGHKTGGRR
jgi:hypothetical protein